VRSGGGSMCAATGNCTASVMGRCYPAAGASIGASFVFGYIAARHAAQQSQSTRQQVPVRAIAGARA
jgi:succinate dehydrogenase/fumarate reductase flavoprotein subunit